MERRDELKEYEQDLVQALWDQAYRRQYESCDSFQLFASNQSIGILECESLSKTAKQFQVKQSLGLVELRSPSGLLIGSILPDPSKRSTVQFLSENYIIELDIQPFGDTKSIQVAATSRLAAMPETTLPETDVGPSYAEPQEPSLWSKLALAAQFILLAGVVFLVADRLLHSPTPSKENGQQIASSQDAQLRQVLEQLANLQNRLEQSRVVSVSRETPSASVETSPKVANQNPQQVPSDDGSLLEKKAQTLEDGILESRPVWVRFKKGVNESRMDEFFKTVSAQEPYPIGGWYSFNLGIPKSGTMENLLSPLQNRGDIEVVTTSVVTRRVQVRFRKDTVNEMIDGFFKEIRVDRTEPKDRWYDFELPLPKSVQPQTFMGELQSGKIIEKVKVLDQSFPRR